MEWSHDVEYHDTMSRFAAGMMFFSLTTHTPFRFVEQISPSSIPSFKTGGKEQQKSS